MRKLHLWKPTALLIAVLMVFALAGCHINAPGTKEYVETVKEDMLQAVNLTRNLREQQKKLDVRSIDDANQYMEILNQLDAIYTNLIQLESPADYSEVDDKIKENAASALAFVKQLKSLVTAAANTMNDSLYKQDYQHIMEQYEECYSTLVDLSSEVTTKYRND